MTRIANDNVDLSRPLELIAANSVTTQDALLKVTEIHTKTNDTTTKSFKKVPPQFQHMMLVASSQGTVVPNEINDEANIFLSSPDRVQAQLFLNAKLESESIECNVSSALTTLFTYGNLLWTSPITPAGLSCMVISSRDIFRNETLYEGMVLELSTKHEISKQALQQLTKTKVLFPQDIEGMMERVYALVILSKLFFGDQSLLVQNLQVFSLQCQKKKLLLKTAKHLDDQFIATFLFSIDDRINKWLNECQKAKNISDTSLELINFSMMLSDIQLNRFICFLPNNIKKLTKKENPKITMILFLLPNAIDPIQTVITIPIVVAAEPK